jgi:hypothetical protein
LLANLAAGCGLRGAGYAQRMSDDDPRADPAPAPDPDREQPAEGEPPGDVTSVESDPAYAPDDEELRRLKGG